jgi:hypothetical protein
MPYSTNPMAEQDGAPRLAIVCRAVEVATDGDIANYGLPLVLKTLRRLSPAEREMVADLLAQMQTQPGRQSALARGAVAEMLAQPQKPLTGDSGISQHVS